MINKNNNQPYALDQPVPIEQLLHLDFIMPGRYLLHATGGFHPFRKIPHALEKYKGDDFPWIEDTFKAEPKGGRAQYHRNKRITLVGVGRSKGWYPEVAMFKNFDPNLTARESQKFRYVINIHRLVASAFVSCPDPEKKILVDHISKDKQDYRVPNLRWVDHKENAVGSIKDKDKIPQAQLYDIYIEQYGRSFR